MDLSYWLERFFSLQWKSWICLIYLCDFFHCHGYLLKGTVSWVIPWSWVIWYAGGHGEGFDLENLWGKLSFLHVPSPPVQFRAGTVRQPNAKVDQIPQPGTKYLASEVCHSCVLHSNIRWWVLAKFAVITYIHIDGLACSVSHAWFANNFLQINNNKFFFFSNDGYFLAVCKFVLYCTYIAKPKPSYPLSRMTKAHEQCMISWQRCFKGIGSRDEYFVWKPLFIKYVYYVYALAGFTIFCCLVVE